jgi:hypothetical protein
MRRYAWAEILILLHIVLKNTEKKKAPKDTLDAELDEIRQLEEVGFLPKGSADKAWHDCQRTS